MVSRHTEAESVGRFAVLAQVGGEALRRNAPYAVLELYARANCGGLPWRKCDKQNLLGRKYLLLYP
jgi:hypothetical protein